MKKFYKRVLEAAFEEIKKHPEKTDSILEALIRMFERKPEFEPYRPYQPYPLYPPLPIDPYFIPFNPCCPTITVDSTSSDASNFYKVYNKEVD